MKISKLLFLLLCMVGLSACSSPEQTVMDSGAGGLNQAGPGNGNETPTEAVGCLLPDTPPPYLGMWSMEGQDGPQMVVFTQTNFYLVESGKTVSEAGGLRERYAEITAIDLEKSQVTLMTKWIRINGKMVGDNSPKFYLTYQLEDGKLSFGTSTEEFPIDLQYGPFESK